MITLILFDGRTCQTNKKIQSFSSLKAEYLMGCMFLHVRFVVNARQKDRWKDGQMRGDSTVCWWETPPLTSSSSVLNSNLFWEAAVTFAKDLVFLSLNSSLWFDIFYSWPRGKLSFHPVLVGWAFPCDPTGAVSCEVSSSRLFWQVLMCLGSNHWHCRTKLLTTGPCGPYM